VVNLNFRRLRILCIEAVNFKQKGRFLAAEKSALLPALLKR